MKVLQVNNVYGEKSTGKLTMVLHESLLRGGYDSLVVYGRGKGAKGKGVVRLCPDWYGKMNALLSRITGMPYGGCFLSTERLKRIIRREKPDVVHLQCINGNFVNIYRLVGWLKKQHIKTVVSLHAEFMYTANCGHAFSCDQWKRGCTKCPDRKKAIKSYFFDCTGRSWQKMKAAFAGFEKDCVICPVSAWTQSRAQQGAILKDFSFRTVFNGVNTEVFNASEDAWPEENTVLNVTACFSSEKTHPKGGWYLLELARRMPDISFRVAGAATEIPDCPENLELLGVISDQKKLAGLYRNAALSIVVSEKETFSMPCAESLCCGTPVVGFRAGAPEQIALKEYSAFVEFGNLDELELLVREWLGRSVDRRIVAAEAQRTYSAETMVEGFTDVYRRILWN